MSVKSYRVAATQIVFDDIVSFGSISPAILNVVDLPELLIRLMPFLSASIETERNVESPEMTSRELDA